MTRRLDRPGAGSPIANFLPGVPSLVSGPRPLGVVKDKGHDLTRGRERVGGRFAERPEHGAGIRSLLLTVTLPCSMDRESPGPETMMALTPAEKQRRYRERLKAGARPVRYRRPLDRRSRPERWRAAVETLAELQEHYQAWLDDLPEGLQGTPVAGRLEAIAGLDLETLRDIDPPSGYGRD